MTTFISGGSSGIGLELAKQFADHGFDLVLVARDAVKLQTVSKELKKNRNLNITTISKDLSDPQAPQEIFDILKKDKIIIDILVNNAGFGVQGAFTDTDIDTELDMIKVNILALTHLTKLFLPEMIARGSGKIMNVASTAGFQPGPYFATYFASKAYVLSFSEALTEEMRGTGVSVTALCPGPTKTGFASRAETNNKGFFKDEKTMSAKQVAKIGYNGLIKNKTVIITGFKNKFLIFLLRLTPRKVVTRIMGFLAK